MLRRGAPCASYVAASMGPMGNRRFLASFMTVVVIFMALTMPSLVSAATYPTIIPMPTAFTQTPKGAVVLANNPGALPVSVHAQSSTATVSAATLQLVKQAARRSLLACMAGVDSDTLPWLVVRYRPVRNSSNPASAFPPQTGFVKQINVQVESLADITCVSSLKVGLLGVGVDCRAGRLTRVVDRECQGC